MSVQWQHRPLPGVSRQSEGVRQTPALYPALQKVAGRSKYSSTRKLTSDWQYCSHHHPAVMYCTVIMPVRTMSLASSIGFHDVPASSLSSSSSSSSNQIMTQCSPPIHIRYLPSLLIQFLCTLCTASCRM